MLDNNLIQSTSAWPFVEIRKLLKERKDLIKDKKKIVFKTGYGQSGRRDETMSWTSWCRYIVYTFLPKREKSCCTLCTGCALSLIHI